MADRKVWQTLDDAMHSSLFQQCRGIMGTANHGQDEALWRALEHFNKTLHGIDQDLIDRAHRRLAELAGNAGVMQSAGMDGARGG